MPCCSWASDDHAGTDPKHGEPSAETIPQWDKASQ